MTQRASQWRISSTRIVSLEAPVLVGILNVTPDSFSDGGRFTDVDSAVQHGLELVESGATMLDVGGESTRPGAQPVPSTEQITRTCPVIERLRRGTGVPISIDTTRADVAATAIDAGADVINDVSGGLEDPRLLPLAADRGCGLVLMHRRCRPVDDLWSHSYEHEPAHDNVTLDVRDSLLALADRAIAVGVNRDRIALDPGLGFGKSVQQNWQLIARIRVFLTTGFPILVGASRKSFIGAVTGHEDPVDRVGGSVAVACWLASAGVQLLRVHDVAETRRATQSLLNMLDAGTSFFGRFLEAASVPARMP